MDSNTIAIDLGYSTSKISYMGKVVKFPTAVAFASDIGISYGDEDVYEFEGEKYYVGKEAADSEAFATLDYKFLNKFAPLLIYHILHKFEKHKLSTPITVNTGLAIVDWDKKDEFKERIQTITVNNETINIKVNLIPQGAGCAIDYVKQDYPDKLSVIDIGYNTINLIGFNDGKPSRKDMKAYPGHGVSSIIKPFTSYMENKFKMTFSEQEAIQVFVKGYFKFNGADQPEVSEKITHLKKQFVTKLFQSILVNDKKQLAMADVVLIAGGGAYMLEDITFPPNVEFVQKPYEYSNARGYAKI